MVKSDLVNYLYFLNEILNEIEKSNEDKTENKVKESEEHTKNESKLEKQTKKLIDDFMLENAFYVSNKYNSLFNESIKKVLYDFCMWAYYKK